MKFEVRHVGVLSVFIGFSCFCMANGDIFVIQRRPHDNVTVDIMADSPADFGIGIRSSGLLGMLVEAQPSNACSTVDPPPSGYSRPIGVWMLLVRRGACTYHDKVKHAQESNYSAVIVYNDKNNEIETMSCRGSDCSSLIPSVSVGKDDGYILRDQFLFNTGHMIFITDEFPFNLNKYLLPFAIVVGICFIIMFLILMFKCYRDARRARRHRLPRTSLKKIPQIKFKKGDPYDICAICLEDYREGEKLRVLPCAHAYHCKCVDPWLTKNKRVCPCCKRKVFAANERRTHSGYSSSSDDDEAPLIRPDSNRAGQPTGAGGVAPVLLEREARGSRTDGLLLWFSSLFRRSNSGAQPLDDAVSSLPQPISASPSVNSASEPAPHGGGSYGSMLPRDPGSLEASLGDSVSSAPAVVSGAGAERQRNSASRRSRGARRPRDHPVV